MKQSPKYDRIKKIKKDKKPGPDSYNTEVSLDKTKKVNIRYSMRKSQPKCYFETKALR